MGWCLDCHRAPAEHLRPVRLSEIEALVSKGLMTLPEQNASGDPREDLLYDARVTNLGWGQDLSSEERKQIGRVLMKERGLLDGEGTPTVRLDNLTSCSTCHR